MNVRYSPIVILGRTSDLSEITIIRKIDLRMVCFNCTRLQLND